MLPAILLMLVTLALASYALPRLQARSVELSRRFEAAARAPKPRASAPAEDRPLATTTRRPGYRFVLPSDAARTQRPHRQVITLRPR